MAPLPLLFFPQPASASKNSLPNRPGGSVHRPAVDRQAERLAPLLTDLEKSFADRRVELQAAPEGVDPEQVLVLETVGRVDKFYKAVQKIPELDWLGEHDIDNIEPDEDFHDSEKPEKSLGGRVYLMMSNQKALQQMLNLWERLKRKPKMKFQKADLGLAKIKDVFLLLKNVRRWGVKDRLLESELLAGWLEDLEHYADQAIDLEVELWFRNSPADRRKAEQSVARQVESMSGRVVSTSVIPQICYHAILVELPRGSVDELLGNVNVELVKNDAVMLFRPTGQMASRRQPEQDELSTLSPRQQTLTVSGDPVIAVLDGCPLLNHRAVVNRIVFDDPDDFETDYHPAARSHGTAMCSLVINGDLSSGSMRLGRPIYSRPILKPRQDHNNNWIEEVPSAILLVDLIHRAVRRMFKGDGDQSPVAPNVKVINLSIGDPYRPFDHFLSPLARLLDWLSHEHQVLFVVSAGNQGRDFKPGISVNNFRALPQEERERHAVRVLFEDSRNRRLLSPAESVNAITVGATHADSSTPTPASQLEELYTSPLGSPVSAFGSGYRRAIKPDLVRAGGRVRYLQNPARSCFRLNDNYRAPGIQVAAPSPNSGELDRTIFTVGTSNSAALLSHDLGVCYENLLQVVVDQNVNMDVDPFGAQLLKALAVHCSDWEPLGPTIRDHIKTANNSNGIKRLVSRWIGYGDGQIERVLECTPQRATALGFGTLQGGEAHIYRFPIPVELGPTTVHRTLRVTLAWFSPTAPTTQRYRRAFLWFNVLGNKFASARRDADGNAVTSGTVQHEIFWGDKATIVDEDGSVEIKVNCKEDVGKAMGAIRYALAVTLEVGPGIGIPIYERVSQRIRQATPVPSR